MTKRLSKREAEVLHLAAHGMLNKEIGDKLHISIRTVHAHVENARIKLGARNRIHAVFLFFIVGISDNIAKPRS